MCQVQGRVTGWPSVVAIPNDWERRSTTRIVSDTRSSRPHPLVPVSLATFWKAVGRTVIAITVLAASLGCSQQLRLVLVLRTE